MWSGNQTNLENTGWSWGNDVHDDLSGWDQVHPDKPALGWGLALWGAPSQLAITNKPHDGNAQQKEPPQRKTSGSGSVVADWEPRPDHVSDSRRENVIASRKSSSSTLEQSVFAFKEGHGEAARAHSLTPTELSSTASCPRNMKFSDPMDAFKATLKMLLQAVRRQMDYDRASTELDQWRRTRDSEAYAHATLATRRKLEEKRAEIGSRQSDAQKKLKVALDKLTELSLSQWTSIHYAINDGEMARFRSELKEWMQQASQHPAMQKKEPEPQPVEGPERGTTQESMFSKEPSEWSFDDISKALTELESRADLLAELVYCEDGSSKLPEEFHSEVDARKKQAIETAGQTFESLMLQRGEKKQKQVDADLVASAAKVEDLLKERTHLKDELATSSALVDILEETLTKLTSLVDESERVKMRDEEQLAELTRSVQNMMHEPTPKIKVEADKLLPPLQATIITHLETELLSVVETFRSECLLHDEQFQAAADKICNLIITRMEDVMKSAQALAKTDPACKHN